MIQESHSTILHTHTSSTQKTPYVSMYPTGYNTQRAPNPTPIEKVPNWCEPIFNLQWYYRIVMLPLLPSGGPCALAIWWSAHNQLIVYAITASKPHPLPLKLLPQTAPIVCSATDRDGQHMALALANGTVVCWNMRTSNYCGKLIEF